MSVSDSDLSLLRQQLHREQAFFDIELQQAKLFEKDSFDSIKSLIFATRKVYSLHLSVLEQLTSSPDKNVSEVPDLTILSKSMPKEFSPTHQRAFQTAINNLISDLKSTSEIVSKYLEEHEEKTNYIVFSLLPALFSCLWSQEETERFIEFFLLLNPKFYKTVSRILLVNPSFFVFLSSIQTDAIHLINKEEGSKLNELLELFESRSFLFPGSVRELLSRINQPKEFFIESILKPLLEKPALYGLLPFMETRTFNFMKEEINKEEEKINKLVEQLKGSGSTIQMQPSENTLKSVLKAHEQLIYLLLSDTIIIEDICHIELSQFTTEGLYQIPAKRVTIIKGTDEEDKKESNINSTEEDPLEALLRSLVIQLDVSRAGRTIEDTLDSALMLHAGASRLQFELRIDEFKQMKKQLNKPDEVGYYINLLTEAYEQRMKHRNATLSNSTASDVFKVQQLQAGQAVQFLVKTRQMTFFNMWADTGIFNKVENRLEEICKEEEVFQTVYKELMDDFLKFAGEHNFQASKDQFSAIVYNRLTQKATLTVFRDYHPELKEKDELIHKMIEERREELNNSNSLPFLEPFKKDHKLMGLSAEHLQNAYKEISVIPIAELIDRALNAHINVLSFQGYKEIGADHWLPMTLILYIYVNPDKIASVAAYMNSFLLNLQDMKPVSQSVEYNVTMAHSAASFFESELDKMMKKKDEIPTTE